jgi:methionyl-tRNA formyltransferase
MKKLSIGFFGDGSWSHDALDRILADETIVVNFVCARDDNPDNTLRSISEKHGIDFFTHPKINSLEFYDLVAPYMSDLFVSMSFNQIFKSKLLDLPRLKAINCHAGKLPFYRGRNVLNWVLINGENEFGITVHYMDDGIDTGDIILQRIFEITETDNYAKLLVKAYKECGAILYDSIKLVQAGNVNIIRQSDVDPIGSYCITRIQGDEKLNWNLTSWEIFNFVRAICDPGPQARTRLYGNEIKINKVELLSNATNFKGIPGSIVGIQQDGFLVKTLDSLVRVTEWTGFALPKIGDRFK